MCHHATEERSDQKERKNISDPVVVGGRRETVKGLTETQVSDDVEGGVVVPLRNLVSRDPNHSTKSLNNARMSSTRPSQVISKITA